MSDTNAKPKSKLDLLREELEAKRAANVAIESAKAEQAEVDDLQRRIEIEDKRSEAYASGLLPDQLLEPSWPGIGRCLARTPADVVYREFATKSGMLKGELSGEIADYEKLAMNCMLVPAGRKFLDLARERNSHALVQFGHAMQERMRGRLNEEGK